MKRSRRCSGLSEKKQEKYTLILRQAIESYVEELRAIERRIASGPLDDDAIQSGIVTLTDSILKLCAQFEQEVLGMVSYLKAKSQKFDYLPAEKVNEPAAENDDARHQARVQRGKIAVEERGCLACHTPGDFPDVANYRKPRDIVQGPDLTGLGSKFAADRNPNGRSWLYSWIKQPTKYHPRTVMPDLFLDPVVQKDDKGQVVPTTEPAADIVEYLLSSTSSSWQPPADIQAAKAALDELVLENLHDAFYEQDAHEFAVKGVPNKKAATLKGPERDCWSATRIRDGRVMIAGGGQILMEVGNARIELRAGLPGSVTQVVPDRGVVIRIAGALVQGVWGNGRIDHGLMVSLIEKPDDVLTAERLDVSLRGSVILGGQVRDVETLRAAAELPLRGLILSSIPSALISSAFQMRFPILVLDGFGSMSMNSAAFKHLTTNNKREATVNAELYDRYSGARPEVIIPLPISSEPEEPSDVVEFASGQTVRLRRPPYPGAIGTLLARSRLPGWQY